MVRRAGGGRRGQKGGQAGQRPRAARFWGGILRRATMRKERRKMQASPQHKVAAPSPAKVLPRNTRSTRQAVSPRYVRPTPTRSGRVFNVVNHSQLLHGQQSFSLPVHH